jgi:hypothetical protein
MSDQNIKYARASLEEARDSIQKTIHHLEGTSAFESNRLDRVYIALIDCQHEIIDILNEDVEDPYNYPDFVDGDI